MSLETNKLVTKAGRIGAPVGAAVALALAGLALLRGVMIAITLTQQIYPRVWI